MQREPHDWAKDGKDLCMGCNLGVCCYLVDMISAGGGMEASSITSQK